MLLKKYFPPVRGVWEKCVRLWGNPLFFVAPAIQGVRCDGQWLGAGCVAYFLSLRLEVLGSLM